MKKSTALQAVIAELSGRARDMGLSDTQWAKQAGLRKETLSRLRKRESCDFATLQSLARVVGAGLEVSGSGKQSLTPDGHFPLAMARDYEEELLRLGALRDLDATRWKSAGPAFFMAGVAVMLGSVRGLDRRGLLDLAEQLHPGVTEPAVFDLWLARSPVRPSRFLPLLEQELRHAA